jgi:hypothetical protein
MTLGGGGDGSRGSLLAISACFLYPRAVWCVVTPSPQKPRPSAATDCQTFLYYNYQLLVVRTENW